MPDGTCELPAQNELRHKVDARSLVLPGLPHDGQRWVFRGVLKRELNAGSEGTAHLQCVFVQIPNGEPTESFDPFHAIATVLTVRLNAGLLPILRPNIVFVNGRRVAALAFKKLVVTVDASLHSPEEYRPVRLVRGRDETEVWFVEYPGKLGRRDVRVQLPCAEVLRATLAANSHFARALVSAPYAVALNKIVDPEQCGIVTPETVDSAAHWALFLRHQTSGLWEELAGLLALHPPAQRALEMMHANFLGESTAFKLPLPFSDTRIDFTVYVHPDAETISTVRASAITAIKRPLWRKPHKIVGRELDGADGTAPAGAAVATPFRAQGAEVSPLSDPLIHTTEDPDYTSSSLIDHLAADEFPLDVFGGTRETRDKNAVVRFSKPNGRGDLTDKGSTGDIGDREGSVSRMSVDQIPYLPAPRIAEVLRVFAELQRTKHVQNVEVIGPCGNPGLDREGVSCWAFRSLRLRKNKAGDKLEHAQSRAWGFVDLEAQRIRTAIAVQFDYRRASLCWIEIDVRADTGGLPRESYLSVIVARTRGRATDLEAVVFALDEAEGRISKRAHVGTFTVGHSLWFWTHTFVENSHRFDQLAMLKKLDEIARTTSEP